MGFEPYLDKHDIAAGKDWEVRLGGLIEAADTIVFVISPDAAGFPKTRTAHALNQFVRRPARVSPMTPKAVSLYGSLCAVGCWGIIPRLFEQS